MINMHCILLIFINYKIFNVLQEEMETLDVEIRMNEVRYVSAVKCLCSQTILFLLLKDSSLPLYLCAHSFNFISGALLKNQTISKKHFLLMLLVYHKMYFRLRIVQQNLIYLAIKFFLVITLYRRKIVLTLVQTLIYKFWKNY